MPSECQYCHKVVDGPEVSVNRLIFHSDHLICRNCKKSVANCPFRMKDNVPYCSECFKEKTSKRCMECRKLIKGKKPLEAMGQYYHPNHFVCFNCKKSLKHGSYVKKSVHYKDEVVSYGFCAQCDAEIKSMKCPKCNEALDDALVFNNGEYSHMKCNDIENLPKEIPKAINKHPENRPVTKPTAMPASTRALPESRPYAPSPAYNRPAASFSSGKGIAPSSVYVSHAKRSGAAPADVVKGETVQDHMQYFDSEGNVVDRSKEFENRPMTTADVKYTDVMENFESEGNVVERSNVLFVEKPVDEKAIEKKRMEKMEGFETEGNVKERSENFGIVEKKETEEEKEEKEKEKRAGFETNGNVIERSQAFGKKESIPEETEEEKVEKEKQKRAGFETSGSIQERTKLFGKKESIAEEDEEKGKKPLTGFETRGSILERSKMFGKKEEKHEEPKDEREKKDLSGFETRGSILERSKMFGKKEEKEVKESIAEEDEVPMESTPEFAEAQKKAAALDYKELPVYPLSVLTSKELPMDVDRARKHYHLSDEEFKNVFGITKEKFAALPQWKQKRERENKKLY